MKPFDLEAAKRGEPVCDAEGRKAMRISFFPEASTYHRVLIQWFPGMSVFPYADTGKSAGVQVLFMAPKKRNGWVNVYSVPDGVRDTNGPWDSESDASLYAPPSTIATIPIEWEE